jgi:hypothetical protein
LAEGHSAAQMVKHDRRYWAFLRSDRSLLNFAAAISNSNAGRVVLL